MKRLFFALSISLICLSTQAQRIQQPLGRGVVAVQNNNSQVTVTWRRLAQEPESTRYNVYVDGTLINTSPLLTTNLQRASSVFPVGSSITVTSVVDGVESEPSKPFVRQTQSLRNIYMEIHYDKSPLVMANYTTKFVWPCDLDGDGEYDYVVDRNPVDGSTNHYLEGYLADGTFLWTVDLGPNESPSSGQDDQICSYDIDCDGLGEVIVQTSDGTRFWDQSAGTWGLYVNGKSTGDTDGDGIIDYNSQTTKNPPKYISVIDGMTGAEKNSLEQQYDEAYNRTNKASLMGDEYNKHVGHVGIFYPDGVHPAMVMEWHTRTSAGTHQYRNSAFSYDFSSGQASNWHQLFMKPTGGATFHQIRIGDLDGDGCDEMSSGAYCMDQDGNTLYNTGIAHGDRHRTSDIDPQRPGLETFSIQQDAGDMLGMILFDAATGEPIKKWYLSGVGDVGRGECLDLDADHLGWEMFSTMNGYQLYDAQGEEITGKVGYFPTEGLWWDGQLDRERVDSPDGSGYNADIRDYTGGRLIEMAKESGYTLKSSNAKRGKYWGDIYGDWREELILIREVDGVCQGIVGFSTDLPTTVSNIYCLQQDPHYRADCTTRGYYQSPNPGFYLGYQMPRPQLPPCMVADEENQVYGIAQGNATITPSAQMKNIYLMPVKGQTLTVDTDLQGTANLWKSQQGTAVLNGNLSTTGTLYISEGTLQAKGTLQAPIQLRARGTLAGTPTVQDTIVFEGALNYEGCRLQPSGVMTFQKGLTLRNTVYVELTLGTQELIRVQGNLNVAGSPIFYIKYASKPEAGEYKLLEYTGSLSGSADKFSVQGLTGLKYSIVDKDQALWLVIEGQRDPSTGVLWKGTESSTWDYQTSNWMLDNESTEFVAGDEVIFDDDALNTKVTMSELFPAQKVTFQNTGLTYTLSGDGGFTGSMSLIKQGTGKVNMQVTHSDYEGETRIEAGTLSVDLLSDTGTASSLGAKGTIKIGKATLLVNNASTSTDRTIQLTDTATIQIPSGTTALKGVISGSGRLVKKGTGQLNLNNNSNSWTGGIELAGGTIAQGAWDAKIGSTGSAMHVTGNGAFIQFDSNSSSTSPTFSNAVTIDQGKTLTFSGGSRCSVKGSLLGSGNFKISFPYVRGDVYTDCSKFEGTYEATSGQLRLRQAMNWEKATLKLGSGVYAAGYSGTSTEGSYTHKIGTLVSDASDCTLSTGVWNVGYLGTNSTYAGIANANATLNKYGDGTLTLTGASAAPINVYAGCVLLNGTATTSGLVTVRSGAMAAGTGTTASISVQKGGTLQPGKNTGSSVGTLTLTEGLTVSSGGILAFRTRVTSSGVCRNDALNVVGTVKLASPTLSIINANGTYAEGQEFTLFTGSLPTLTGTVTMEPAQPAAGLLWDTSKLADQGILGIVADPDYDGILSIEEAEARGNIFDLSGKKVNRIEKGGIYIVDGRKVTVK